MKGKTHDLNHDLTFSAHTINCVCHSIRLMFRVLGIYNFGFWTNFCLANDRLNPESPVEFSLRFRKFGWAKDFLLVSHEAENISGDFIVAAHYDWIF